LLTYELDTNAMLATTTASLTDYDLYLLGEGDHYRLYEKPGAHLGERDGTPGTHFAAGTTARRVPSA